MRLVTAASLPASSARRVLRALDMTPAPAKDENPLGRTSTRDSVAAPVMCLLEVELARVCDTRLAMYDPPLSITYGAMTSPPPSPPLNAAAAAAAAEAAAAAAAVVSTDAVSVSVTAAVGGASSEALLCMFGAPSFPDIGAVAAFADMGRTTLRIQRDCRGAGAYGQADIARHVIRCH